MAHIGQEVGLEARGLLRQLLGTRLIEFRLLLRADIDQRAHQAGDTTVAAVVAGQAVDGRVQLAVGERDAHLGRVAATFTDHLLVGFLVAGNILGRQSLELHNRAPQQLVAADPEGIEERLVEVDVAHVGVLDEHRVRQRIEQHPLEGQLIGNLLVEALALADIADGHAGAGATPLDQRQAGQAQLHRKLAALAINRTKIAADAAHRPGAVGAHELGAHLCMLGADVRRHQVIDTKPEHGAMDITEQLVSLGVGNQDGAAFVHHQHAIGREFDDLPIPGLRLGKLPTLAVELLHDIAVATQRAAEVTDFRMLFGIAVLDIALAVQQMVGQRGHLDQRLEDPAVVEAA